MGKHHLTLLGFSPRTYPILIELAADFLCIHPNELQVLVILNMPESKSFESQWIPSDWLPPTFYDLENWDIEKETGIIMPGTMHEPSVSMVWNSVTKAKPSLSRERLGRIIHPSAEISASAQIGTGTWVHPNVTVSSLSVVGFCCHLNRNSSLGHHNILGDFSRLNPGAHTAGFCNIGSKTTLGIGAVCIEKITVGSGCIVGAGAVIISDGTDGQRALGVPAKWQTLT